jgi:hypothetical protein
MNINLVSKKYVGIISTLFLIVLLSQSIIFNSFLETALGRINLILFILVISYTSKILGIIAVLFIIIMFNQSNIAYMEGFTEESNFANSANSKEIKDKLNNMDTQKLDTTTISSAVSTNIASTSETFTGKEGFNIVDREGTILKGKNSNEIPVLSNARNQMEDVEPTEKSVFLTSFSSF